MATVSELDKFRSSPIGQAQCLSLPLWIDALGSRRRCIFGIANTKRGHMVGFEDITAEVALEFYGLNELAEELRNVLFRSRDLAPFTGTYKDRRIMYDGMINAFDKAISRLGKELQVNV
jgi:hypothetical protein